MAEGWKMRPKKENVERLEILETVLETVNLTEENDDTTKKVLEILNVTDLNVTVDRQAH